MKFIIHFTSVILLQAITVSCFNESGLVPYINEYSGTNLTMAHEKSGIRLMNAHEARIAIGKLDERDLGEEGIDKDDDSECALNMLMDTILEVGLQEVYPDIAIPDIEQNISSKVGLFNVTVKFNATHGILSDIHTLRRAADAFLNVSGETLQMKLILTFQKMSIYFRKYSFEVAKIPFHGDIRAIVRENEFLMDAGVMRNRDYCELRFNEFKLTKFDGIEIYMNGMGPRWVIDKVATWLANHYKNEIRKHVEEEVFGILKWMFLELESKICDMLI